MFKVLQVARNNKPLSCRGDRRLRQVWFKLGGQYLERWADADVNHSGIFVGIEPLDLKRVPRMTRDWVFTLIIFQLILV